MSNLLCWSECPRNCCYSGFAAGLGEVRGVIDGFASGPGVGEGRVAEFFSGLEAGEAPGDGLLSVVGDFFGFAVECVVRW